MDIRSIQYQLRKRRLDEIFDFSILVIRQNFLVFLKYCLPPVLIFVCFNVFILTWVQANVPTEEREWFSFVHLLLLVLISWEQSLLSFPLILLNGNLVFSQKPTFRSIFSGTRPAFWSFLLRTVLFRTVLYTFFFPTLLSIWWGLVRNFFQNEVILLERLQGRQISRRLSVLTRSRSERTLGFLVIDIMLAVLFVLICLYTWDFVLDLMRIRNLHWSLKADFSLFSPITHVLIFIYSIFHSVAKFLYYIDTRSLLEGWDIELMLLNGVRDTEDSGEK